MMTAAEQRITVCHIITKLELGGAQQNTLFTVTHLNTDLFVPLLITGCGGILDEEARASGVKTYFVPSLIRQLNPLKDMVACLRLYCILKKERPQIVHTHSSKAGILGRIAARLAGVPIVIHTFHGFGFNDYQRPLLKKILILAERLTAPLADRLVVVTTEDRKKGLAENIGRHEQYLLIRSGIDTLLYKNLNFDRTAFRTSLGIPDHHAVVTTIGPFKPQKNLVDFITVAALVAQHQPDTTFLVIGDGAQRPLLEAQIQQAGIQNQVRLLGWRRDIPQILGISNLFVMTSLWEGLPRSILEAMCAGVPVVANAVDGVKEIIMNEETGFLIAPRDTAGMKDRILSLLNTPSRATGIIEQARSLIDHHFDIHVMVRQQEDLYRALETTRHSPRHHV